MFKVGQCIYAIEVEEDYWDEAEISGLLFMAECGNYIIACIEYMQWEDEFENQLEEMCEESRENFGVEVHLVKKDLCFETYYQAEDYRNEMREDD